MRRPLAILATIVALANPAGAVFAQEPAGDGRDDVPILFKADSMRHDRELGVVVATGHVEITRGERTLLADSVTYNQKTDTVVASGNVSLSEPGGDVLFAEYAELSGDFKDGIARTIRIRLADDSRMAANSAIRAEGVRSEMRKAVYSPCKPCKDKPERTPIWQIKAYKVVHDRARSEIEYSDAFLEIYGVPVAYMPYLTHPDPSVKRRSGFLIPTYGSDGELGINVRVPYYFNIAPDKDATFTPIFTSREGFVGAGEYRQRVVGGQFQGNGSMTHATQPDGTQGLRGHFDGLTRYDINDYWRAGLDIEWASDDTYLRRYGFSSENTLTNRLFAEWFSGRNYGTGNVYYFQGLRQDDDPGQTPIIHPQLDFNYVGDPGRLGGRWSVDANLLALTRTEGTDMRRLSLKTGWLLPYTSPAGELFTFFASVQTDGYSVDEFTNPDDPDTVHSGTTGRIFPQIGLDWRFPLARDGERVSEVIEPIAGIIAAPNGGNPDAVPNEDSLDFELDDTNIFNPSRFTGLDRVEGGQRLYYGLKAGIYGHGKGSASLFVGQSYRFRRDTTFPAESGLEDHFSDYIGRVRIAPATLVDLLYRFRLDKNDFNPRRNEVTAGIGPERLRLSTTYIFIDQSRDDEFTDREEISASVAAKITRRWTLGASTRRDLTAGGGPLSHGLLMKYEDDCLTFTGTFNRSFTRDRDVRPTDTIMFRVAFRTLGEVSAATRP